MEKGTFKKVGESEERMFGPTRLLVCGYASSEQKEIQALVCECLTKEIPLIFATKEDEKSELGEILDSEPGKGKGISSDLKRAVIMSGLTEKELHLLLNSYRENGFPRQLWATLTPVSEKWTLGQLLNELSAEAEAFRKNQLKAMKEKNRQVGEK